MPDCKSCNRSPHLNHSTIENEVVMKRLMYLILFSALIPLCASDSQTLIVKDENNAVVATMTGAQINDGAGQLLGKIVNASFMDSDGKILGAFKSNGIYTPEGHIVVSGKQFGKYIRWRTGNIAFRIDTLDGVVRLINSYNKAELTVEQYRSETHFIPLMFYIAFFHSTSSAPPGYEREENVLRVALKSASGVTLNSDPVKGEIAETDYKVYNKQLPFKLERRMDVYRLLPTQTGKINIEVRYDKKEVDVRLLDKDQKLVDPSDALTVDRNEGIKTYPYAMNGDAEYILLIEGYPPAPYSMRVFK